MKWTYVKITDCSLEIFFHHLDGALVTALLQETRNDTSQTKNFSLLNNVGKLSVKKVRNVWDPGRTVDDSLLKSFNRPSPLSLFRLLNLFRLLRLLRTTHGNANHTFGSGNRKPPHPFKVITGLLNKPISIPQNDINVQLTSAAWRNPATTPMRG